MCLHLVCMCSVVHDAIHSQGVDNVIRTAAHLLCCTCVYHRSWAVGTSRGFYVTSYIYSFHVSSDHGGWGGVGLCVHFYWIGRQFVQDLNHTPMISLGWEGGRGGGGGGGGGGLVMQSQSSICAAIYV